MKIEGILAACLRQIVRDARPENCRCGMIATLGVMAAEAERKRQRKKKRHPVHVGRG